MADPQKNHMKEQIRTLEEEVERLRNRSERVVQRIVQPPDYERIREENRQLEKQISKYKQLLAMDGTTELTLLIDQYIDSSKKQLKRIASEIKIADFDRTQIQVILRLAEHLQSVEEELTSFLTLYLEGKWSEHPASRKIDLDIQKLQKLLSHRQNFYAVKENQQEAFHHALLQAIEVISGFVQPADESA